jgi:hypothetical protein
MNDQDRFEYEISREQWEIEHDPAYNKWLDSHAQWWADYDKTLTKQEKDMLISTMKPSKYVKKEDVGDGLIVTIANMTNDNVAMDNQPAEMKWVMHFKEDINPLVMNWTNLQLCAQACGSEDTDDWVGKQIVLWNDPNVSFAGKMTGGVRIRSAQQTAPTAAPARASEDPNDDIPF